VPILPAISCGTGTQTAYEKTNKNEAIPV